MTGTLVELTQMEIVRIATDLIIAGACFSIPFFVSPFMRVRRASNRYVLMIYTWAALMLGLGILRSLNALNQVVPIPGVDLINKIATGLVIIYTSFMVHPIFKQTFRTPSYEDVLEANSMLETTLNQLHESVADDKLKSTVRNSRMSSQLLAFSRLHTMALRPVDLNRLVGTQLGVLRSIVGPDIAVELDLQAGPLIIYSDNTQLEVALVNLAMNARDAMSGQGSLRISTFNTHVVTDELPPGDYVCMTVGDTGAGMSPEVAARALDPLYTTKSENNSGLGLSMVHGLVRQSGGRVMIQSRPRRGTIVTLCWPRLDPTEIDGVALQEAEGHLQVLVVDDDPEVLEIAVDMLRDLGYWATPATSAQEALQLTTDHSYQLIMTDYSMPVMNGMEMAAELRNRGDETPVLYATGYVNSDALRAADREHMVLHKPYSSTELANLISETVSRQYRVGV